MTMKIDYLMPLIVSFLMFAPAPFAQAGISLDRTRIIFPGNETAVNLTVFNKGPERLYLDKGWLEDEHGVKLNNTGAFSIQPAEQMIEPKGRALLKIQAMPVVSELQQDRETLYYFNLLENYPDNNKDNTAAIKLQMRIKMFYRPAALAVKQNDVPFQKKITLTKNKELYIVNNPTPYFVIFIDARTKVGGSVVPGFEHLVIPPKSNVSLDRSISELGENPVLFYVNDYGDQSALIFRCDAVYCKVVENKAVSRSDHSISV